MHTHTHTDFRVSIGKTRKPLEKNGWPEGRQACDGKKMKNKLRQARRTVKRIFTRLCRPLIPIASDPRQRLAILKSNILILHSRKQVPLMQPLVLQFFQRRKMLLKCVHFLSYSYQQTIDFSVLPFFVLYFLFFSIHVFFHFFSFK